jgi:hypothetical protein
MATLHRSTAVLLSSAACLALCAARPAAADGTVAVGAGDVLTFEGFGIFPAPYDRQLPTYSDGSPAWGDATWLPSTGSTPGNLQNVVCDLGFEITRAYVSPTIGKPDGTLDVARLQDLKDHLSIIKNAGGQTKYILTVWSPPAHMKLPDRVRYGSYQGRRQYLDPAYADGNGYDYSDFLLATIKSLTNSGFPAPLAVSIQNEPDVAQTYDGCVWVDSDSQKQAYRNVVKHLRTKLNDNGLSAVKILAPEDSGYQGVESILGAASTSGFSVLNADTAFRMPSEAFATTPTTRRAVSRRSTRRAPSTPAARAG